MNEYLPGNSIALVIVLIVICFSCKKEEECSDPKNPECPNYDPCLGQNPTSADFQFLARYGFGEDAEWIPETKFIGSPIRFSATDKNANSYTWYLGTDTFTGLDEVELDISNLPIGSYSAILVTEKEPNLICFPNDQGADSLEKYFDKVSYCDCLCFGSFKGINEAVSTDSITISIELVDFNSGEICEGPTPRLINLFGIQDTLYTSGSSFGTYSHYSLQGNGSGTVRGEIIVNENSDVVFNYRLNNLDYSFVGIKIE